MCVLLEFIERFHAEIVVLKLMCSAGTYWKIICCNWWFSMCVAQRNSVSLPQLNLLQRIDICCRFVCCAVKFGFTAAIEPPAAKWYSLPQLNLQQRSDIHCRFVCCAAKFCFAAATEPPAAKWYSLPSCALCSETVAPTAMQSSLPNWQPAANQFSLPKGAACSELVLAVDFYNKPPRHKWLKC